MTGSGNFFYQNSTSYTLFFFYKLIFYLNVVCPLEMFDNLKMYKKTITLKQVNSDVLGVCLLNLLAQVFWLHCCSSIFIFFNIVLHYLLR